MPINLQDTQARNHKFKRLTVELMIIAENKPREVGETPERLWDGPCTSKNYTFIAETFMIFEKRSFSQTCQDTPPRRPAEMFHHTVKSYSNIPEDPGGLSQLESRVFSQLSLPRGVHNHSVHPTRMKVAPLDAREPTRR